MINSAKAFCPCGAVCYIWGEGVDCTDLHYKCYFSLVRHQLPCCLCRSDKRIGLSSFAMSEFPVAWSTLDFGKKMCEEVLVVGGLPEVVLQGFWQRWEVGLLSEWPDLLLSACSEERRVTLGLSKIAFAKETKDSDSWAREIQCYELGLLKKMASHLVRVKCGSRPTLEWILRDHKHGPGELPDFIRVLKLPHCVWASDY